MFYICYLFSTCVRVEKLWLAPEHLRAPQLGRSPAGDVYAYGILLQEIALQAGPYDNEGEEPQGISLQYHGFSCINFIPKDF